MKQGNFSELRQQIYDPGSTRQLNGQLTRDPFAGNAIPQARFDPVAAKVQAVAPAASPAPAQIPEVRERAALPTVALVGSQRPAAPAKGHAAITGIGFRPQSGGEVIVRSDRPLRYGVSSLERAVLLHLPDAAIPLANNRRPLDTRVFGGTVQRIVPLQHSGGTEVRIELREPAEVHLNQSGSLLTLSFTPGS